MGKVTQGLSSALQSFGKQLRFTLLLFAVTIKVLIIQSQSFSISRNLYICITLWFLSMTITALTNLPNYVLSYSQITLHRTRGY